MIFFHSKIFMTFFTLRILVVHKNYYFFHVEKFFFQATFFLFIHLLFLKIKSLTMKIKVYNIFWFYCNCSFFSYSFFMWQFFILFFFNIFFLSVLLYCDLWYLIDFVISLLISDNVDTHKFIVCVSPVTD